MTKNKLPYEEGAWFAVPLRTNGYAIGLVARMNGEGGVFGYFFGPKQPSVPDLSAISGLYPGNAVLLRRFGDLGLIDAKWPIIGQAARWDRSAWPLPPFINYDAVSGRAVMVVLDDLLRLVSQEPCDSALHRSLPEDADSGYGAVEIRLTKLLDADTVKL